MVAGVAAGLVLLYRSAAFGYEHKCVRSHVEVPSHVDPNDDNEPVEVCDQYVKTGHHASLTRVSSHVAGVVFGGPWSLSVDSVIRAGALGIGLYVVLGLPLVFVLSFLGWDERWRFTRWGWLPWIERIDKER